MIRLAICVALQICLALLGQSSAVAEAVYKCTSAEKVVYSQSPCAKADAVTKTLDVSDARSTEQREQSQASVQAQSAAADALEFKRIANEAKEAKLRADQEAAAAKARQLTKAAEPLPVVVQPIIVVRPTHRQPSNNPPPVPQKPYCHLSALRC